MGLFSSKYETQVGTTVSRVIEDNALPHAVKSGSIKGLFDGNDQFIENILDEVSNCVGVKAERMFNYAKKNYIYGLPSNSLQSQNAGLPQAKAVIEALVGQTVSINYFHFGALNNLHTGWMLLCKNYAYNVKNNNLANLTAIKGTHVMLTNVAVVITAATLAELSNGSLDQWDGPANATSQSRDDPVIDLVLKKANTLKKPKLFELDPNSQTDYLRVDYSWQTQTTTVIEGTTIPQNTMLAGSFNIPFTGFNENADWYQVKYTRADGEIGYFSYESGTGLYPVLDAVHSTSHSVAGEYFPWGYFRFNNQSQITDKQSVGFKQNSKLMDYLSMDFESITDAINQNPDINKVEQAMLMMAVPATTQNEMEIRYLYDYFDRLVDNTANPSEKSIVIQDKRFKMALNYGAVTKKIVQGNLGKIGKHTAGYDVEGFTATGTNVLTQIAVNWSTSFKSHWYRRQITDTQYEEIRVKNLKMVYYIFEQYTATGDEDDAILMIPLDRSITENYSIPNREELYARSLHYVFNSKVVTEIKWYQQSIFRYIMIAAAIVITIITYGETWQSVVAAVGAGTLTVTALMYIIAVEILKYVLISLAIKVFVHVVGVKFAFIVAIVAAVAGSYQAIKAGSVQGAPFAQELLQLSTGLAKGVNIELGEEFKDLKQEADEFNLYVKEQNDKLKEANKLLENDSWMIPLVIFGEKPDDYYQRTVHSGNIGVLSLDAISAFVDVRLQLPKLSDTL